MEARRLEATEDPRNTLGDRLAGRARETEASLVPLEGGCIAGHARELDLAASATKNGGTTDRVPTVTIGTTSGKRPRARNAFATVLRRRFFTDAGALECSIA